MADTTTTILNLTKPEVGASSDTWGAKINTNLDTIDGLFQAGPAVKVANGGTGATTAAGARTNLDVPQLSGANTFPSTQTFTGNAVSQSDVSTANFSARGGAGVGGAFIIQNSNGTIASPTIVTNGQLLGYLDWRAYDGATYRVVARISSSVDGAPGLTDTPGSISFQTTADGISGALTERLRIGQDGDVLVTSNSLSISNADTTITRSAAGVIAVEGGVVPKENRANTFSANNTFTGDQTFNEASAGNAIAINSSGGNGAGLIGTTNEAGTSNKILINANRTSGGIKLQTVSVDRLTIDSSGNVLAVSSGGLGYGTGAGGTQSQTTSKSNAVTVNKPTGTITMNSATLNAGAMVTFTLNNSVIQSDDTVIVHRANGGSGNAYRMWVDNVSTGSCNIRVENISASNLTEQPVIRFTVIKSANA